MPKLYSGEEHVNVPPGHVRDEQVEKWRALKAQQAKPEKPKMVELKHRDWCQPGEAIRHYLEAEGDQ